MVDEYNIWYLYNKSVDFYHDGKFICGYVIDILDDKKTLIIETVVFLYTIHIKDVYNVYVL